MGLSPNSVSSISRTFEDKYTTTIDNKNEF